MDILKNTHYVPSHQYQLSSAILFTLFGVILAIPVGAIYAVISNYSPIIILDLVLIVGLVFVLGYIIRQLIERAKSRNRIVNMVMAILVGLSAYYANLVTFITLQFEPGSDFIFYWLELYIDPMAIYHIMFEDIIPYREITITSSSSGRRSSGLVISEGLLALVYFVELIGFLAPTVLATKVNYFCESCQQWYKTFSFITRDDEALTQQLSNSQVGHYADALQDVQFYKNHKVLAATLDADTKSVNVLTYEYNLCPDCLQQSILNIKPALLKKEKKNFVLKPLRGKPLAQDVYIDRPTDEFFNRLKNNLY